MLSRSFSTFTDSAVFSKFCTSSIFGILLLMRKKAAIAAATAAVPPTEPAMIPIVFALSFWLPPAPTGGSECENFSELLNL